MPPKPFVFRPKWMLDFNSSRPPKVKNLEPPSSLSKDLLNRMDSDHLVNTRLFAPKQHHIKKQNAPKIETANKRVWTVIPPSVLAKSKTKTIY